jgi:hypothetical protein
MSGLVPLLFLLASAPPAPASLDEVRQQVPLERRSDLALDLAFRRLADARTLTSGGESAKTFAALEEVAAATELALKSLRETGKRASKLARYFKRGELRTREFLRRLDGLIPALPFDDRAAGRKYRERVQAVHEDFLLGIMSGK